ncbi:MAG: type II toxin-antitoxin system VapC family toxin [Candidatus Dormibacteria bacterium]
MADAAWLSDTWRATSLVAYAECRAGLARAHRAGRLPRGQTARVRETLDARWLELEKIGVTEDRVRHAGHLADRHGLRGFDALHLASALAFGDLTVLITWDRALAEAARAEGLMVRPG